MAVAVLDLRQPPGILRAQHQVADLVGGEGLGVDPHVVQGAVEEAVGGGAAARARLPSPQGPVAAAAEAGMRVAALGEARQAPLR